MASKTTNYGLTKLDPGEDLDANGYAFVSSDRDRIDGLLALGREHVHTGASAALSDPTIAPSLTLDTTEGALTAGTTYRYRYTYVDEFGAETAASPEATVTTADPVVAPSGPTLSSVTTGGLLNGGLYTYVLTAYVTTNTKETTRSSPKALSVAFTTSTNVITLTLPSLPTGATGFNVYRRGPGEVNYNYLDSVDMDVATPPSTYDDDGSVNPNCSRFPPNTNNTNSQNNVTISLPGATPTVPAGATWKIYRSTVSGVWEATNLVQVTAETFEGSGVVTPTYQDLGIPTGFQTAPEVTQVVGQPDKINLTDVANVQGILPPGKNVIPYVKTWEINGATTIQEAINTWRCPFDYAEIQEVSLTLAGPQYSAGTQYIIADVNYYSENQATPAFTTIFTTQANRPTIPINEWFGAVATPDIIALTKGDLLNWDIDQDGGGATPTDYGLIITILMHVVEGSTTVTDDLTD